MRKKIRVGIVGVGFAARLHAIAYKRHPLVEITAVAGTKKEKVDLFKQEFSIKRGYIDYRDMLRREEIDIISICVPTFLHKEVAVAAMKAGKHVVCEKPLAINSREAEEMIAEAKNQNVLLMYAEDWIFAPALRKAVEISREGGIGDVLYIRAKESHSGSHSIYAQKVCYAGGGAMIHLGIHPVGFVLAFMDTSPKRVWGITSGGGNANLMQKGCEGEDWGLGVIEFQDGKVCQVEANYITRGGIYDIVEFYGTEGLIEVHLTHGSPLRVFSLKGLKYTVEKAELTCGWSFPAVDEYNSLGYQDEIDHFVKCVLGESEVKKGARAEDGLQALKVIEAIYTSAKEGRCIHF